MMFADLFICHYNLFNYLIQYFYCLNVCVLSYVMHLWFFILFWSVFYQSMSGYIVIHNLFKKLKKGSRETGRQIYGSWKRETPNHLWKLLKYTLTYMCSSYRLYHTKEVIGSDRDVSSSLHQVKWFWELTISLKSWRIAQSRCQALQMEWLSAIFAQVPDHLSIPLSIVSH